MKQICVCFPRIAVAEAEAPLSESVGEEIAAALRGDIPFTMVVGSPVVAMKAFAGDQDDSQVIAEALAQGICNVTLNETGYHASEIDSTGAITELTDPAPTAP